VQQILNSPKCQSTSDSLRILHVTPNLTVGGAEQMAAHLMIGLAQSHKVAAVGLLPRSNSVVEERLANAGIPVWHLNKRLGFDPRMFSSLTRLFREFQPDVLHSHMAVQRYVFPVLLRSRIPAAVHTVHNLAEHETDAVGRVVHWFAFRNQVLPVGISQEVSASIKRVYGLECKSVIPNCIPVERYQYSAEDRIEWRAQQRFSTDDVVFTCVARLEPQKNPILLLKALGELNHPKAHLVFLGYGSLEAKVAAYAKSHDLSTRVHLLGKQDNVSRALAGSDVFVLGSDWEGNPLAVMEAMACGLPVIGTAVGGVPELVHSGEHGTLVPAGDWPGFCRAMGVLLRDPEKRRAMASAARARAMREFRLERMVQGYGDLYQEMVASRRMQSKAVSPLAATHL